MILREKQIASLMGYKILKRFSFIIFCLSLAGCATVPPSTRQSRIEQPVLLQDICRQNDIEWHLDSTGQVVTLQGYLKIARAMIGSNIVMVDSEQVTLSSPLKREKNDVFVSPDFKRLVIDRLSLAAGEYSIQKLRCIVIDPGHGGKDPGAIGKGGLKEKVLVLDIAQQLKKNLENKGIRVVMTRDRDEFIPLEERARIANRNRADLFVSVHANSSRSRSARGLEVYFLRNLNLTSRKEIHSGTNYREMFQGYAMKQHNPELENTLLDMLFTNKQSESRRFAGYISRNTADDINAAGRGSKSSGFSVLRNTLIPAVLVEVGFLSNRNEENLLGKSSYRRDIADSLAKSIFAYANQQ